MTRKIWQVLMFHPQHAVLDNVLANGEAEGYQLSRVTNPMDCLNTLDQQVWDLLLVPACLEDGSEAADIIALVRRHGYDGSIAVLSELPHATQVSRALQVGATDYLLIPFGHTHLGQLVQRIMQTSQSCSSMVAKAPQSKQLLQLAQRVAQTDASVLINGESGTGKEVLASFIHNASPRSQAPFVAINCAAIPETMIESILFGHAKGAFTGASSAQPGKLEIANGGTLLLDEIAELPLGLQTKLLRVLQEKEVERLGSHQKINLDIRVLAATNQDLEKAVAEGRFRADLYYRLNVFPLCCASLRDRTEDIIPLAKHLLKRHMMLGQESTHFTDSAKRALTAYTWPGNVRELENIIQRALVMSHGCLIRAQDLMLPGQPLVTEPESTPPDELVAMNGTTTVMPIEHQPLSVDAVSEVVTNNRPNLQKSRKLAEFNTIIETLRRFNGHRSKTAEELGVSTRALRYKLQTMREQGMDVEQILTNQSAELSANNYNFS
ncbi:sigma-54-dependent transcriptional regulator [Photobacterium sanguinicancri]|uniref:sigma-54-dependent transcriptional regulator n=1 Tax=Photobacterium sanguinicancri TaxID=875932 RepID=UPI0021C3F4E2|nr:sigma-54 dependent transcriptional regulator [Photobacterium sanguinicancri]